MVYNCPKVVEFWNFVEQWLQSFHFNINIFIWCNKQECCCCCYLFIYLFSRPVLPQSYIFFLFLSFLFSLCFFISLYISIPLFRLISTPNLLIKRSDMHLFMHWRRKRGGRAMVCLCPPPPPPILTPHFFFPLELYVYITLTNNYLAFFIYQILILWTISIN